MLPIYARLAPRLTRNLLLTSYTRTHALPALPRVALTTSQTRSFLTTPQTDMPAKATTDTTKPKSTKTVKPKTSTEKLKPKKKPVVKKPAVGSKKKVVEKPCTLSYRAAPTKYLSNPSPPTVVIKANMRPPRRPTSPYLFFFKDFLSRRPKVTSLVEMQGLTSQTAAEWRALTPAEKQVRLPSDFSCVRHTK